MWSLSLTHSGAIGTRLLRRLKTRATRYALREHNTASCTDSRVCTALVTKAFQPHRLVNSAMCSPRRALWVLWERMGLITRCCRLAEPRPRPTEWVVRSTCFAHATLSHPSTRWSLRTGSRASKRVALAVIGRFPRPLGGVKAARFFSALTRRVSQPAACRAA